MRENKRLRYAWLQNKDEKAKGQKNDRAKGWEETRVCDSRETFKNMSTMMEEKKN